MNQSNSNSWITTLNFLHQCGQVSFFCFFLYVLCVVLTTFYFTFIERFPKNHLLVPHSSTNEALPQLLCNFGAPPQLIKMIMQSLQPDPETRASVDQLLSSLFFTRIPTCMKPVLERIEVKNEKTEGDGQGRLKEM
jgi:hypothetical protein